MLYATIVYCIIFCAFHSHLLLCTASNFVFILVAYYMKIVSESSEPAFGHLMYNKSWSLPHDVIGQVAGLATDHDGNLYVFHRGSRKWDSQ